MPTQPSQDLDARFSVFLNPIRDLTKNWEVDIAKYLEDYLVELSEIQITFDGGVTVMNFAEAAMLIQGSATVYSKKVEFLWQMVMQMLDLLSSKRIMDLGPSDDSSKGSTTRGSRHSQTLPFESIGEVASGKHIDLKDEDEEKEKITEFKFLPAIPLHLVEKEGEKSGMRIPLYLKNNETFGNKEDYRINRSYLTPSGLLCLDLPHEILQQNVGLTRQAAGLNDSVAGFIASEGVGDLPNEDEAPDDGVNDMPDDGVDHGGGFDDMNDEPEQEPVTEEVVRQITPVPADDLVMEMEDAKEKEKSVVDVVNGRCGLRKRVAKENVVEVKITEPLKPCDPHIETPSRRPIRAGRMRKPLPCNCHREQPKRNSRRSKALKKNNEIPSKTISVEKFITKDLANLIANNNNVDAKGALIDPRLLQEFTNEQARKQEKIKKEKMKEAVANKGLTEEEAKEKADEEERLKATEDRCEDEAFDNDGVPNLDFDHFENGEDEFLLPDPHNNIVTPFGVIRNDEGSDPPEPGRGALNDTLLYEPGSEYEALVQKWVSDYIANAQEHIASSDITRRVNRWKKTISPKLLEEEERKAFDIHEYGSHVLSHFPSDDDGGHVLFSQVGQSDDRREVSRIFLSCLMLANTYNVELSNTREGDMEMDCLQLKLLSRVRHHQELDEYAASAQQARPASPTRVNKSTSPTRVNKSTSPTRVNKSTSSSRVNKPTSPHYSKKKKNKRRKVQTSSDESDGGYSPVEEPEEEDDFGSKPKHYSSKARKSKKLKTINKNS